MKIAIDCCDLDHSKVDGTRVYIKNVLDRLGALAPNDQFLLYHQKGFDPLLAPRMYPNYIERKIPYPLAWTQTRFAFELRKDMPDVCWMPIQQIPLIGPERTKYVVTIHDLAWKYFPENYKKINRIKLDFFAQTGIKKADALIAVSNSTKNDILKFHPKIDKKKIHIVHHGFNKEQFEKTYSKEAVGRVMEKYKLRNSKTCNLKAASYLLYVGGLDEKENLKVLIQAFNINKKREHNESLHLVLVGCDNENSKKTLREIASSAFKKNICVTGGIDFDELVMLYQNAAILVLPSKYEGFGITVLEGFACKVPVVVSNQAALLEVGGDAVQFFDADDATQLEEILQKTLENSTIREEMTQRGSRQAGQFSWEKCARETLEVLHAARNEK